MQYNMNKMDKSKARVDNSYRLTNKEKINFKIKQEDDLRARLT